MEINFVRCLLSIYFMFTLIQSAVLIIPLSLSVFSHRPEGWHAIIRGSSKPEFSFNLLMPVSNGFLPFSSGQINQRSLPSPSWGEDNVIPTTSFRFAERPNAVKHQNYVVHRVSFTFREESMLLCEIHVNSVFVAVHRNCDPLKKKKSLHCEKLLRTRLTVVVSRDRWRRDLCVWVCLQIPPPRERCVCSVRWLPHLTCGKEGRHHLWPLSALHSGCYSRNPSQILRLN